MLLFYYARVESRPRVQSYELRMLAAWSLHEAIPILFLFAFFFFYCGKEKEIF